MHVGLNTPVVREIERLVGYASLFESATSSLWSRLLGAVVSLGRSFRGSYEVDKEKVELLFWVHKAFLAGFIPALILVSLR
jgi:hypothetical protein